MPNSGLADTEAGRIGLEITARSGDELAKTFERHHVAVLHLDHEAFGVESVEASRHHHGKRLA